MHEPLATAFSRCAEHVLGGPQSRLHVVDIPADANVDAASEQLSRYLVQAPLPGSLILCDLYGATPFNVARNAIKQARQQGASVELLTGANLNMVLKALTDPGPEPYALRENVRSSVFRGMVGSNLPD